MFDYFQSMETRILDEFVDKAIAFCNCQKSKLNDLEQIRLMIKEKQRNNERCKPTQELSQYFQSSVPDLKIICGDGMIIMSHKLLLGLTNECLAKIFNEEDFINDPLTVLKLPNSPGDHILNLSNYCTIGEFYSLSKLAHLCLSLRFQVCSLLEPIG